MASEALISTKHRVVTMWECDYAKIMDESDPEYRKRINAISSKVNNTVLECGAGLFGGRCNPIHLYYKTLPGEKIHYVDFCSLYPSVMKANPYPVGAPNRLVGTAIPTIPELSAGMNDEYFGIVYVSVLPPQNLYLPVLPYTVEKKPMFPLCKECARLDQGLCDHTPNQRSLKGVYTTAELKLALEMGYEITNIYEIWTFKKKQGLFSDYIAYFLKDKIAATGYPGVVNTDAEKDEYIASVNQHEGLDLTRDDIEYNPGKRTLAKLSLNSLWGKFGQRCQGKETAILATDSDVIHLLRDTNYSVLKIDQVGSSYVATYEHTEHSEDDSKVVNLPIAIFTTAYARIKLYGSMHELGHRLLYTDTDSAIFVAKDLEPLPTIGQYLGDLTDEIRDDYGEGAYGSEFCAPGPKSYALRIETNDGPKFIVKAKGLTLGPKTERLVNFTNMKLLVEQHGNIPETPRNPLTPAAAAAAAVDAAAYDPNRDIAEAEEDERLQWGPPANPDAFDDEGAIRVPYRIFRAGEHGGVSELRGDKRFSNTYRKRFQPPGLTCTIPFGYIGPLPTL